MNGIDTRVPRSRRPRTRTSGRTPRRVPPLHADRYSVRKRYARSSTGFQPYRCMIVPSALASTNPSQTAAETSERWIVSTSARPTRQPCRVVLSAEELQEPGDARGAHKAEKVRDREEPQADIETLTDGAG